MVMFRMEVAGAPIVSRMISRFADVTDDLSPAWKRIADDFLKVEARLFGSEGASGGEKWAPLSPAYAEWKEKHYPGKPILEREGDLMRSLVERNSDHIERISPDQLVLGTRDPKAMFHQRGTRIMPARPPIMLSDYDRTRWTKMIQRYLVEEATRLGLRDGF